MDISFVCYQLLENGLVFLIHTLFPTEVSRIEPTEEEQRNKL